MANPEKTTVIAVFDDFSTADRATRELVDAGIQRDAISVKSNFRTGAAGRSGGSEDNEGGIAGFFRRLFSSDDEDKGFEDYAEAIRRGSTVLCVDASEPQLDRAVEILNSAGAVDIERRIASYRQLGYQGYDANAPAYSAEEAQAERSRMLDTDTSRTIPVVEEELQVGKRAVTRGGVRVYSHVVERPVEEDISLREEHVTVERRAVDRAASPEDAARMQDQSIEVIEHTEEPVISKRTRIREEVVVGKSATERVEHIRDTVRGTEVEVENLSSGTDYSDDFRRDYEQNYSSLGARYEEVAPAYEYGYQMASDPRYKGRSWSDVETDLGSEYSHKYPGNAWDRMKNAVRYGWEKVTGQRR